MNHWRHDADNLSIRATHSTMSMEHLTVDDGWVVEIYPLSEWPMSTERYDDVDRFFPCDATHAKRIVLALMIVASEHHTEGMSVLGPDQNL